MLYGFIFNNNDHSSVQEKYVCFGKKKKQCHRILSIVFIVLLQWKLTGGVSLTTDKPFYKDCKKEKKFLTYVTPPPHFSVYEIVLSKSVHHQFEEQFYCHHR